MPILSPSEKIELERIQRLSVTFIMGDIALVELALKRAGIKQPSLSTFVTAALTADAKEIINNDTLTYSQRKQGLDKLRGDYALQAQAIFALIPQRPDLSSEILKFIRQENSNNPPLTIATLQKEVAKWENSPKPAMQINPNPLLSTLKTEKKSSHPVPSSTTNLLDVEFKKVGDELRKLGQVSAAAADRRKMVHKVTSLIQHKLQTAGIKITGEGHPLIISFLKDLDKTNKIGNDQARLSAITQIGNSYAHLTDKVIDVLEKRPDLSANVNNALNNKFTATSLNAELSAILLNSAPSVANPPSVAIPSPTNAFSKKSSA